MRRFFILVVTNAFAVGMLEISVVAVVVFVGCCLSHWLFTSVTTRRHRTYSLSPLRCSIFALAAALDKSNVQAFVERPRCAACRFMIGCGKGAFASSHRAVWCVHGDQVSGSAVGCSEEDQRDRGSTLQDQEQVHVSP